VTPEYWATLAAAQVETISAQQFALLNPVPVAGTFLQNPAGELYRVAGGAALPVSHPALFPGAQPVTVDPWDLVNAGNPQTHLEASPLDGTIVEAVPSSVDWVLEEGRRRLSPASPAAVAVDGAALAAFPALPCAVPRLARLTLAQARRALLRADCRLGTVHVRRAALGARIVRVVKQTPRASARRAAGYAVDVALG